MAKAAVSAWTACIKDLQQLVDSAPGVPGNTYTLPDQDCPLQNKIARCVKKLHQQPPLPHAAWKKLVQDVQVTP
jgi:hypothetical protein